MVIVFKRSGTSDNMSEYKMSHKSKWFGNAADTKCRTKKNTKQIYLTLRSINAIFDISIIKKNQIIPSSPLLQYIPSGTIIRWSNNCLSNTKADSLIFLVITISDSHGCTLPLGWLWYMIIAFAFLYIAYTNSNLFA